MLKEKGSMSRKVKYFLRNNDLTYWIKLLVSDENRKLMESILAKSVKDQYEIGSRVATLLAGTSLTTTAGVDIKRRDPVEEIGYETVGKLLSLFIIKIFGN